VGVRRIAAGKDHSLAITNDGAVFTWGRGDAGQLGHGCFMDVSDPKQVMALAPLSRKDESSWRIIEAAGGGEFSLFLTEKRGYAYICGRDPSLALDHELLLSPVLLTVSPSLQDEGFGSEIAGISCGDTHYCLVTKRGALAVSKYYHQVQDGDSNADDGVDGGGGREAAAEGSTTTEREDRRLDVLGEVGHVVTASAGGSHTLALVH
jgi:alpha-tubulin suppressor-like RCC1 family protein